MKKTSLAALILFVLIVAFMSNARAQSPQQTLDQYVTDLQKNPMTTPCGKRSSNMFRP